jgi:hypothetical protein
MEEYIKIWNKTKKKLERKNNLDRLAGQPIQICYKMTNRGHVHNVTQFLVVGERGWLTAHQPTKNQSMLPSLSTHPLASSVQKKSLPGLGRVFLAKSEWELEAPVGGEVTVHQEMAAETSRCRGGATRGDATTSRGKQDGGATRDDTTTRRRVKRQWRIKRLWRNKKPRYNQPGKWEVTAR